MRNFKRLSADLEGVFDERDALLEAGEALIADVRRRYPGEELRCPYMIALDAACRKAKGDAS